MAIYEVSELEQLLGTSLGDEDVAAIREIESDAVGTVEEMTNRRLGSSTSVTEVRSGEGDNVLALYNDTSTITSVEIRDGSSWTTISADEYAVFDDNKLVRYDTEWPEGHFNVRIVYTAGYEDPRTIPRDLRKAVGLMTTGMWRAHRRGEEYEIPEQVMRDLDRWAVHDHMPQPRLISV